VFIDLNRPRDALSRPARFLFNCGVRPVEQFQFDRLDRRPCSLAGDALELPGRLGPK